MLLCHKPEGRGFDSQWFHLGFSLTQSFRSHYDTGVDSASNINEFHGYLLRVKDGRCVGLTTLPLSCVDCVEILGASTSWSPKGLYSHVQGQLYGICLFKVTDLWYSLEDRHQHSACHNKHVPTYVVSRSQRTSNLPFSTYSCTQFPIVTSHTRHYAVLLFTFRPQ
jgi:hypothetical protein